MYSKKTIQHFQNPHNYGEIENPDGLGKVGNIICGDIMHLYIKVKDDIITDIKFKTFGCAAAIATSSAITDIVKGKNIYSAIDIEKDDIVDHLDGLPPIKVHCSLLATDALYEAIYDYLSKSKKDIPESLEKKHEILQRQKDIIEEKYGKK